MIRPDHRPSRPLRRSPPRRCMCSRESPASIHPRDPDGGAFGRDVGAAQHAQHAGWGRRLSPELCRRKLTPPGAPPGGAGQRRRRRLHPRSPTPWAPRGEGRGRHRRLPHIASATTERPRGHRDRHHALGAHLPTRPFPIPRHHLMDSPMIDKGIKRNGWHHMLHCWLTHIWHHAHSPPRRAAPTTAATMPPFRC